MSKIKDRILEYLDYKDISNRTFCKEIEVSPNYLSYDNEVMSDILLRIYIKFPEISIIWLITGEGDMLVNSTSKNINSSEEMKNLIQTNKNLSDTNAKLINKLLSVSEEKRDAGEDVGCADVG